MERVETNSRSPKESLPRFSCWNTGQFGYGWTPDVQCDDLSQHPGWIPWFELYADLNPRSPQDAYYRKSWEHARANQLPIHFVFDNLVDSFRTYTGPGNWQQAQDEASHPWLIKKDGSIVKKASPLGTVEPWFELGRLFGRAMKPFADTYVPPYVLLSDNNEVGCVRPNELREDYRLDPAVRATACNEAGLEALRTLCREGYGKRFARFREGIELEIPQWKGRLYLMGYGTFGQRFGIINYPPDPHRYSVPWVTPEGRGKEEATHDGVWSNTGYLTYRKHHQVRSGVVESCNLHFAWHHFEKEHRPIVKGQIYWPAGKAMLTQKNWLGHIRCSMWMAKPEHVMYFMPASAPLKEHEPWFIPLRGVAYEIHQQPVLRRHWTEGRLMEAPEGHPYRAKVPAKYEDPVRHRWFVQHVPLNQRFDEHGRDRWVEDKSKTTQVEVWSFVSEWTAEDGSVERLLYACATLKSLEQVEVEVHGVGKVVVPEVPQTGKFWLLADDGSLTQVQSPLDGVRWEG